MGIKLKVDERGRITIPTEIREAMKIEPLNMVVAEEKEEGLLIYKQIEPEEFIGTARELQESIKATKVAKEDALKAKEIWKGRI